MNAPKSFIKKDFLTYTVIFEVVFSVCFLFIYKPYSDSFWLGIRPLSTFWDTLIFYTLGVSFTFLSKLLLCRINRRKVISINQLSLWHLAEFAGVAIIYLTLTYLLHRAPEGRFFVLLFRVFICLGTILFTPYFICLLIAIIKDDREEIKLLKLNYPLSPSYSQNKQIVNLYDHSGVLKISASQDDIYFIEAQDNYVNIHYEVDGILTSYLLRCRTTEVEKSLNNTHIIRCHRSYLVNVEHIKVLKHKKGSATVVLSDKEGTEIPVSKSYYSHLLEYIQPEKLA